MVNFIDDKVVFLGGVSRPSLPSGACPVPHRLVLTNAQIHTMDAARPIARTLIVAGSEVVGVDEPFDPAGADVCDLGGRVVVPGFIDSHNHLSIAALYPRWVDLSRVRTADDLFAALQRQDRNEPDAEWIRAANWVPGLHEDFNRHLLDSFGFDRPIMLAGASLHEGVVDSQGLDHLQISAYTEDPSGGRIERDAAGQPTGYLIETAWSYAHAASLRGYHDPDRWAELIVSRAQSFLAEGVTAIHDAACSPQAEAVYRDLARQQRLPISVLGMPHPAAMLTHDLGARLDGPPTGDGDEWFRVGPVKLFADGGSLGAMSDPADPHVLAGGIYFEAIEHQIPRLMDRGFRVAVHAVGDYAVRGCLTAFEEVARRRPDDDHRFRLEHVVRPRPEQIHQLKALDVVVSVQPGIIDYYGDEIANRAPQSVIDATLPFAGLRDAGVHLGASSDDPCAPFGPLRNSITGATRRTPNGLVLAPQHAMPLLEWLRAYTAGSAIAGGQENERGRLAPGLRADFVVLDGNLDAEQAPAVAETWVAGQRVWQAADRRE